MKRFQLFIRGISTNWTGTVGVALTTSAFLMFVFFELLQLAGILTNSYVGLISYMALPALFMLGLILVPIGWWQFRRATGRSTSELLTQRFPDDMTKAKRLGSSLVATIALLTAIAGLPLLLVAQESSTAGGPSTLIVGLWILLLDLLQEWARDDLWRGRTPAEVRREARLDRGVAPGEPHLRDPPHSPPPVRLPGAESPGVRRRVVQ